MKRIAIIVLLLALACFLALPVRSAVSRNWVVAGPGGQFGYVEKQRWDTRQKNATPQLLRSRILHLGPFHFALTDTTSQAAAAGLAVLGIILWRRRGAGGAVVEY